MRKIISGHCKYLMGMNWDENDDEMMMLSVCLKSFRSPARNDPRSGLLQMSGGRLFQSLAVLGKNECLCVFILEHGNEYLDLSVG